MADTPYAGEQIAEFRHMNDDELEAEGFHPARTGNPCAAITNAGTRFFPAKDRANSKPGGFILFDEDGVHRQFMPSEQVDVEGRVIREVGTLTEAAITDLGFGDGRGDIPRPGVVIFEDESMLLPKPDQSGNAGWGALIASELSQNGEQYVY